MLTISPQLREFTATRGYDADLLALPIRLADETATSAQLGVAAQRRVKVFLDTKDWVNLARARLGQPEGQRYATLYEDLKARALAGEILAPLCATSYMELTKNANAKQRFDVATVVAEISGFATFAGSRPAVAHQVRTSMASLLGRPTPEPFDPFGYGISYAFGDPRRLIMHQGGAPADMSDPGLRELSVSLRAMTEFEMLLAPKDEEMPGLRADGYQPEKAAEIQAKRLEREKDLAKHLAADPSSRPRLSDIVAARYLVWELMDYVVDIAPEFGLTPVEFLDRGKDWLTSFVAGVSSAAVHVALIEANFRNRDKTWKVNDLFDADAMASAVPYCDVVMTDAHVARQIADSEAVRRHGARVLSKPDELLALLPDLVAAQATAAGPAIPAQAQTAPTAR